MLQRKGRHRSVCCSQIRKVVLMVFRELGDDCGSCVETVMASRPGGGALAHFGPAGYPVVERDDGGDNPGRLTGERLAFQLGKPLAGLIRERIELVVELAVEKCFRIRGRTVHTESVLTRASAKGVS
jgi:hypothetical protein